MKRRVFKIDKLRCLNNDCHKASYGTVYNKSTKYKFCPFCGTKLGFITNINWYKKAGIENYFQKEEEMLLWKIEMYQDADKIFINKKLFLRSDLNVYWAKNV